MSAMTLGQVRDWHTKCAVVYEQSGESALADQHRSLAAAITAHLTQPAQSVDVADVRTLLECVEDEHGGDHFEANCRHCAAFDRLTAALQDKTP